MPNESSPGSNRHGQGAAGSSFLPDEELTWTGLMVLSCVIVAGAVVIATWDRYVLAVAGAVVPGWLLSSVLVVTALLVRRRDRRRSTRPQALVTRWPMTVAAVLVLVVAAFNALNTSLASTYVSLEPRGPGGCRVIVRETSFLMAGSGDVYLAPRDTGIGAKVGTYRSDDGGRPVSTGTYDLNWSSVGGSLILQGPPGAAVYDQDIESLTC